MRLVCVRSPRPMSRQPVCRRNSRRAMATLLPPGTQRYGACTERYRRMTATTAEVPPVLRLRHLSKQFGGTRALDDVALEVSGGVVHGLLGHNGSGKSTLIRILAGYHAPEPGGELELGGVAVRLPLRPGQFRELGMAFVHQDQALLPALTVTENLRIGAFARGMFG